MPVLKTPLRFPRKKPTFTKFPKFAFQLPITQKEVEALMKKLNVKHPKQIKKALFAEVFAKVVCVKEDPDRELSPLEEIKEMDIILFHYKKLSSPSRDFTKYLIEKYQYLDLPVKS